MAVKVLNENTPYGIECVNTKFIGFKIARRVPHYIGINDDIILIDYDYVIILRNGGERVVKSFKTDYSGIDINDPEQRKQRELLTLEEANQYIINDPDDPEPGTYFIKLEDGSYLLLENSDKILLEKSTSLI